MNSSPELKNLFEALAKAQAEMPMASLNSNNPFYKSRYANLPEIIKAARPVLTKQGLSVIQGTREAYEGKINLYTRLCHTSGEWIESVMPVVPTKPGIQEIGKEMTYLRRYQYACITGVVASDEEDDDGESAMQPYRAANSNVERISREDYQLLTAEIRKLDAESQQEAVLAIRNAHKIATLNELPKSKLEDALKSIRSKLK